MVKKKSYRKLAAIVFTDIVGFTALSAKDEEKAFDLLNKQRTILKPIVEEFEGEWLKEIGDGLLLTFPTVSGAVNCSIEIQKIVIKEDNLKLRIGIHEGEITVRDGDVFGDDVNIASRIEPFAASGGIAISGKVQQNISSLPEYKTKFIGNPKLKGVTQKVEVHCIISHGLPETIISDVNAKLEPPKKTITKKIILSLTGMFFTLIGILVWFVLPIISFSTADEGSRYEKKIAVLYLENRGNTEDNYFADGLTEEIISRLSRIKNLSVASRFDVLGYKGKVIDITQIEDKLNVDFILTGNINRSNQNVKISVELVNTKKRDVLWADSFSKNMEDLFTIQDEVALNIVNNLDIEISSRDQKSLLMDPASNTAVFDELSKLKSEAFNLNFKENGSMLMIENLDKIITKDSTYADAIATRGLYYFFQYFHQGYWISANPEKGKNLVDAAIRDSENALYYDPKNVIALGNLPIIYLLSLWSIPTTSGKIFTARKAFVQLDDLNFHYPNHFMTNLVRGLYYRLKARMVSLSSESDYDNAIKYLDISINQSRNGAKNMSSEPLAKKIYEETLKTTAYFKESYQDFSGAISYYNELIDLYKNENKMDRLAENLDNIIRNYLLIGNYEGAIDLGFQLEKTSKRMSTSEKKLQTSLKSSLHIAHAYIDKGEEEVGLELLKEHEFKNKTNSFDQFEYDLILSEALMSINLFEEAEPHIMRSLVSVDTIISRRKHNEWQLHLATGEKMFSQSLAAQIYFNLNDFDKTKYFIEEIKTEILNQPRIYYKYSVHILYNISKVYKDMGEINLADDYLKKAIFEMNRISNILNEEHKQSYLENIKENNILNSLQL